MARVIIRRRVPELLVNTAVRVQCGPQVICRCCGYTGPADVLPMPGGKKRTLNRCPACFSLNILPLKTPPSPPPCWVQDKLFDD